MRLLGLAYALRLLPAGEGPAEAAELERSFSLSWSAPLPCPSAQIVDARVRRLLGSGVHARGEARAQVWAQPQGYRAEVELRTSEGTTTRTFSGDACDAVADAVALVVAVGLDPVAVAATATEPPPTTGLVPAPAAPEAEEGVDTAVGAPPAVAIDDGRARPAGPRRPLPVGLRGFVSGAVTVGLLRGPGGTAGGGLALTLGAARIELSGAHEIGRRFTHPLGEGAGAQVSVGWGRVGACWTGATGRFIFPLCAGAEVGAMTARGRGLAQTRTTRAVWAAAVPSVRALWFPVPIFGFGLVAEAPVALVRPRFAIDDFEADLLRTGPVGGRFGVVLEVTFFDENGRRRR